jgi:hypothetical protein
MKLMNVLTALAAAMLAVGCVQVPTSNGEFARVFGTKADYMAIADPMTGQPIFVASNLDQTDGLKFARDSFIADRLFSWMKADTAATAATDQAGIKAGTDQAGIASQTTIATEQEITKRAMIEPPLP